MSQEPARDDRVAHGTHPRRVLLKLSGEVFGGGSIGLDPDVVSDAARQIAEAVRAVHSAFGLGARAAGAVVYGGTGR